MKNDSSSPTTQSRKPYVPTRNDPNFNRIQYYSKITTQTKQIQKSEENVFRIPAHILPPQLYLPLTQHGKVGSIATIFSIWNTMVGSTLLAIPWGFRQSGIVLGCIVFFIVGFISYYTCCLVVKHSKNVKELKQVFASNTSSRISMWKRLINRLRGYETLGDDEYDYRTSNTTQQSNSLFENEEQPADEAEEAIADFSEVCVLTLGKWSQILALIASVLILVGATVAYHIFMKDCLSSVITGIGKLKSYNAKFPWQKGGPPWYWNDIVASIAIIIVVFPLSLFKDLTFLGKINSFGVFFVLGLLAFVIYSCTRGLIDPYWTLPPTPANITAIASQLIFTEIVSNLDDVTLELSEFTDIIFSNGTNPKPALVNHLQLFSLEFSHLLAILSLSFFIHNVIVSILKNQRSLSHTGRDSGIAFILAGLCYLIPGVLGSVAFRFVPEVEQNFLNQFANSDIPANVARSAVLLQLMGIFPLLLYVIRVQLFGFLMNKQYPGFILVFFMNLVICVITTAFASFYPQVGTVLRYVGAICGLVYLFILPIGVHLSVLKKTKQLTWYSFLFHSILVLFGVSILVLQFIPFENMLHKH
jgi:sodium-coupled neutral amino acid transporter 9